jgi:hypothetical protein
MYLIIFVGTSNETRSEISLDEVEAVTNNAYES